jgi:hypothetical protein
VREVRFVRRFRDPLDDLLLAGTAVARIVLVFRDRGQPAEHGGPPRLALEQLQPSELGSLLGVTRAHIQASAQQQHKPAMVLAIELVLVSA